MKFNKPLSIIVLFMVALATGAAVAAQGQKRSKNLKFDGRSVEAVKSGRYDSFTHLSNGDGAGKKKKLYDLPKNFSNRIADETLEMGYRK